MRDSKLNTLWEIPLALLLLVFVIVGCWINPRWDFKHGSGPETLKYWKQVCCRIIGHKWGTPVSVKRGLLHEKCLRCGDSGLWSF